MQDGHSEKLEKLLRDLTQSGPISLADLDRARCSAEFAKLRAKYAEVT